MDPIPDKDALRAFLAENPDLTARRDIARAFGIRGAGARAELKRLLRELQDEAAVPRRGRRPRAAGDLPPVAVVEVLGPDADGDLWGRLAEGPAEVRVLILPRRSDPAPGAGDRLLCRLSRAGAEGTGWEARPIRRLDAAAPRVLGIFRAGKAGGRIQPVEKGADREWTVAPGDTGGAKDGELVEGEATGPGGRLGLPRARVTARLGDPSAPRAVSLIAIRQHGIPDHFPEAALAEAAAGVEPGPQGREDLRHLPFVTIDPPDARDRDDAVFAEPDADPANPGGHVLWVAIADVAHFVRPGSALDREARLRGNSTYFPDRVVPMLPDRLSGDLCSLHAGVDRAVIAVRMVLDREGEKRSHRFARALIRSSAALHYAQVQAALDGAPDAACADLMERTLRPLAAAHAAAAAARDRRAPLDLELPEREIVLDAEGRVLSVAFKERLPAHRLIEDFMVQANVCAAETLIARRTPLLFRVHEEPDPEKLDALREVARASGLTLAKGQVLTTAQLNRLLAQAEGTDRDALINIATLRSLPQAFYNPENLGHFGLALRTYAHFTSPIRRYADLIVHRALITAHRWGEDGLSPRDIETLEETARLISEAERRSMAAERDTTDRYLAAWLADRVGQTFTGRVSGVTRFGLFVKLDGSGADGLVPIREVGREYFWFDREAQTLTGSESGLVIAAGARVTVRLATAEPATGGLTLELLAIEDKGLPGPRLRRGAGKGRGRGPAPGSAAGLARRIVRRRR